MVDDLDLQKRGPTPLTKSKPKHPKKAKQAKGQGSAPKPAPKTVSSKVMTVAVIVLLVAGAFILINAGLKWLIPDPVSNTVEYGPYEFEFRDNMWAFEWQQEDKIYNIPLRFNPNQVENVSIRGSLNESFNRDEIFLSFNPETGNYSTMSLATGELALNMVKALGVKPIAACTKNMTDACEDRPILTCDTYPNTSVILIRDEGEARIWLQGDCIVLFGEEFELLRSVDRLLYQWYGVLS